MVEFVEPEPDEQLPEPTPSSPRRALLTRTLAVAVVIAAVATWAITRPDPGGRPSAAHRSSPPAQSSITSAAPDVIVCHPGRPSPELLAAMRRYLHGLVVSSLTGFGCVRDGKTLVESITGRDGSVDVEIDAEVRTVDGSNLVPGVIHGPSQLTVVARLEALTAGLHVIVLAYGRHGTHPPIGALRDLVDYVSLNVVL